ncbi:BamA/TamA family outer membrane protein [uncultured Shewanella sp.]|uniref:BamA/TamA family outer membrane protein n=1 Tax=uncultured Shewanella sp. TaxID=173975 RepID=UPI002616037A|nr:BamA/TamA family outer membrane protein [uncultured Shewanella sp.]
MNAFLARLIFMIVSISLCLLMVPVSKAAPAARVKTRIDLSHSVDRKFQTLVLPYAFSTDSLGLNLGIGGMLKGAFQEQMTMGATAFAGEESQGIGGGVWNYQVASTERFYLSAYGFFGYYPDQRAYTGGSLDFTPADTPLPGSNASSNEQYLQADGASNWFDVKLEYVLPIGSAQKNALMSYQLKNGLLVSSPSGGGRWDPLTRGVTILMLRQFNRYQRFEFETNPVDGSIRAAELGVLYDNTDFPVNPTQGSRQYIAYSQDISWLNSDYQWTFVDFEMSQYFSFGESEHASQRILALDFWTGKSPSWALEYDAQGGRKIIDNAPYNEGATLGGFYRLRGYDQNRFSSQSVIYGTAEYRYTLKYNPVEDVNWLRFLHLDWFQLVGFVEAGRVAEHYTAKDLLSNLKVDYGFSLRALTAGIVVRADIAHSDESTNAWVMIDHPF